MVLPSVKFVLLPAPLANTLGEDLLGGGIPTLFEKLTDWKEFGGRLVPQRNILLELEFRLLKYPRGKRVWLVVTKFLVLESFLLTVSTGLVTVEL